MSQDLSHVSAVLITGRRNSNTTPFFLNADFKLFLQLQHSWWFVEKYINYLMW